MHVTEKMAQINKPGIKQHNDALQWRTAPYTTSEKQIRTNNNDKQGYTRAPFFQRHAYMLI